MLTQPHRAVCARLFTMPLQSAGHSATAAASCRALGPLQLQAANKNGGVSLYCNMPFSNSKSLAVLNNHLAVASHTVQPAYTNDTLERTHCDCNVAALRTVRVQQRLLAAERMCLLGVGLLEAQPASQHPTMSHACQRAVNALPGQAPNALPPRAPYHTPAH